MKRSRSRIVRTAFVLAATVAGGLVTAWVISANSLQEPMVEVPGGDAMLGRGEVTEFACIACHTIPGVPGADAHIGPPLDNWAERHFVVGTYPNEPEHLVAFLMDPQQVHPGTAMPDVGLTEEQARNIAAFLYTLYDDWPILGGAGQWPLWRSP